MAAISITPANVQHSSAGILVHGIAGAAITAGQLLYKDSTDNTLKLADADLSAAAADIVGIAQNGAAVGQPVTFCSGDSAHVIGGTVAVGTIYCAGPTAGEIVPLADLAAPSRVRVVGIGVSTTAINVKLWNTGLTLA